MTSIEARKQLLYALRNVLRPIVRLLIRAGVRFDEFADLARGVYVESAIRDGANRFGSPTRERIAVLAGVTRHQVDYYIDNEGALPSADPTMAAVLLEVLQKWHTDPQYGGPYGIPLELEFEAPTARNVRSLVGMVDSKANPGLILEELIRVGSVVYSGEKHFRAVSRAFMMPESMSPQQIEYFGNALTRLATTLEHNMNPRNTEKRLERFVVADRGLPIEAISAFEEYARAKTADFLVDLDNWLIPYSSADSASSERLSTGLNVFLYVEPPKNEDPLRSIMHNAEGQRGSR
jgi:hypothetical protein